MLVGMSIASIAIGCGGTDGGETSSLTKAEFSKLAEGICAKATAKKNASLRSALKQFSDRTLTEATQESLVVTVALPPIRAMTKELGALDMSSDYEPEVREMVDAFSAAVQRIEKDPRSALAAGFNNNVFNEAGRLANEFGLKACAQI